MIYREYQASDREPLIGLMLELGYAVEPESLERNVEAILEKGGCIFVAEDEGTVLGSICTIIDARLAEGIYAEIVSLVVTETARGKGVGKDLVKSAEEWAGRRAGKMRVRANSVREQAHAFYAGQGYTETKTQRVFSKKLSE